MKTLNDFLNEYYNALELATCSQAELDKRISNYVSRYDIGVGIANTSPTPSFKELKLDRFVSVQLHQMLDRDKFITFSNYLIDNPDHKVSDNNFHLHFFKHNWLIFEKGEAEQEADKKEIIEYVKKTYQAEVDQANADLLADEEKALSSARKALAKYEADLVKANKPNLEQFKQLATVKNELTALLDGVTEFSYEDIKAKCSVKDNSLLVSAMESLGYSKVKKGTKNVWVKEGV
ncbi:hypothetical protein [Vibrio casei]|uniref:hypothetical protein n=1 Tax=Vibrio casei TaxID=673372 RepID=UPI000B5C6AE0|nr:hypothetical protein [Vibrio casei]